MRSSARRQTRRSKQPKRPAQKTGVGPLATIRVDYPLMSNPESLSLVPYAFYTHSRFVETWDNTTGAPGFYDWVLRGNSVYDPDFALSADSCYGHDAMAQLYTQYKVHASTVKVTIVNNDDDDPVNVAVVPTGFSNSFSAANQDGVTVHPLAKNMVVSKLSGGKTLVHTAKSTKLFGVRDLDSVNFRSEMTTNPATAWYWHVVTYNNAGSASDCEMRVEVIYDVEYTSPAAFTQ